METFKTIKEQHVMAEIIEKKSKFISNLFYIETSDEAEEKIKEIKKKYYDAKHNCFAYLIYDGKSVIKKCSDDGEPSGTAGVPMLEILEKNNIYNVLIVVTRYFGGILLGTGGLLRAYSQTLKEALNNACIVEKENGYEVYIKLMYQNLEKFKYYCSKNNINIIECNYSDIIICKIEINDSEKNKLIEDINNENNLKIIEFDIIRQKSISKLSNNIE